MAKHIVSLLRHGEVVGPAALYGHTDVKVTALGQQHMWTALDFLQQRQSIDSLVSSSLLRCAKPSQSYAEQHNITWQKQSAFKEMNFGIFDGVSFDQLYQSQQTPHWQELALFWQQPQSMIFEEGERLAAFYQRITKAWQVLFDALITTDNTESAIPAESACHHTVLVTHGGVIRMILCHLLNLNWQNPALFQQLDIGYASLTQIEFDSAYAEQVKVKFIGFQCHQ